MSEPRMLVLASHDSFLKAGLAHARAVANSASTLDVVLLAGGTRQGLSRQQLSTLGLPRDIPRLRLKQLFAPGFLEPYDVVWLGLESRGSREFSLWLRQTFTRTGRRRPLVISFYPGLIFRFHLEAMQSRLCSDLSLLNSPSDAELYRSLETSLGLKTSNGLCVGLGFLSSETPRCPGSDIVFFGQPTVPPTEYERDYVVCRLVGLARQYPQHRVILKPRHRPGETTLHRDRHHYEQAVSREKRHGRLPANFEVSYAPVDSLIERAALTVTVSSSTALESLARSVPTRVVTDFGIHENLGNHFFLGSGLLCTFDELRPDLPLVVEPSWQLRHLVAPDRSRQLLKDEIARLLELRERGELADRDWRFLGRTAAYVRFVEQRYGWSAVSKLAPPPELGLQLAWNWLKAQLPRL